MFKIETAFYELLEYAVGGRDTKNHLNVRRQVGLQTLQQSYQSPDPFEHLTSRIPKLKKCNSNGQIHPPNLRP